MRKIRNLFMTLLLALVMVVPAFADVIVEPEGEFYQQHQDECTLVNRKFSAGGAEGTVTAYKSPEDYQVQATFENGETVYIDFVWQGEELEWGHNWNTESWLPMDDLALFYDSQSFIEDHEDEFTDYDGSVSELTKVLLYSYPNSGEFIDDFELGEGYMTAADTVQHIYTDEQGNRWSYIGYYLGTLNCWFCLDDPMNDGLDSGNVPIGQSVSQQRAAPALTGDMVVQNELKTLLLPGGLVLALVAGTVFLIQKRHPKKGN